jgi:hypothetical protein
MTPQRFRSIVLKRGIHPDVDVPSRVSRAFEELARSGRISVESARVKTEMLSPTAYIYQVRIERPEQLDRELIAWLRESYTVGRQQ